MLTAIIEAYISYNSEEDVETADTRFLEYCYKFVNETLEAYRDRVERRVDFYKEMREDITSTINYIVVDEIPLRLGLNGVERNLGFFGALNDK